MGFRTSRAALIVVALGAVLCAPGLARAEEAAPSVPATGAYELDFTLPSEAQSGCMVCHGDPALVRVVDGQTVSYYVDPEEIAASSHAEEQCVGCHVDFTYTAPHESEDWAVMAKTACRNCHDEQSVAVGAGVHRAEVPTATASGGAAASSAPRPLCGDCHGSHDISLITTDTPEAREARAAMHRNGWEICGRCHQDYWDNYADYWHGAAYKQGALDAPACWDCHGWHEVVPSSERNSMVNESHLVETCGQDGCHTGVDENYVDYAGFIHHREEVTQENPLYSTVKKVTDWIGGLFGGGSDA
jgi:hypothetical protein